MKYHDDTGDPAIAVANRRRAVFDGNLGAVPADQSRVIGQADDLPEGHYPLYGTLSWRAIVFVDDFENALERLALGVCNPPSGHRFGDGIQVADPSLNIHRNDGVANAIQRDFKPLTLLLQLFGLALECLFGCHQRALGAFTRNDDAFGGLECSGA